MWCLQIFRVFLFFDFQSLKSSPSIRIVWRFSLWHLCEYDKANISIFLFICSSQGFGSYIPLFVFVWPGAEDHLQKPGKFWLCHIPFVFLLWRTAELHKVMKTHREQVKETHFACVSEGVWDVPRGSRFQTKVAELSIWCSKVSTLPDLPWSSLERCWLQQMERDCFFLTIWGKVKWIWIFTKTNFSEDTHHTLFPSWVDLPRRRRAL